MALATRLFDLISSINAADILPANVRAEAFGDKFNDKNEVCCDYGRVVVDEEIDGKLVARPLFMLAGTTEREEVIKSYQQTGTPIKEWKKQVLWDAVFEGADPQRVSSLEDIAALATARLG